MGDALCVVHAVFQVPQELDGPARFGFIVSKSVGNAVQRNLVRRRLKSIAHQHIVEGLTGVDVVIRARPQSLHASFTQLEESVAGALVRLQRKRAAHS